MAKTPRRSLPHAKGRKMSPKEVKAGAAAMGMAMMKKAPATRKPRKSK